MIKKKQTNKQTNKQTKKQKKKKRTNTNRNKHPTTKTIQHKGSSSQRHRQVNSLRPQTRQHPPLSIPFKIVVY